MKKIILRNLMAAGLLMAGAAQASVFSVTDWDGNQASDIGLIYQGSTVTSTLDGNDILYSWTRTGDLDGGTVNDTLRFDVRAKAWTGASYSSPNLTLGTVYNLGADYTGTGTPPQHFGPGGDIDINQSFQLSIENISFTQGEGLGWVATFNGFSAINVFAAPDGTKTFYVGTTDAEVLTPAVSDLGFTPVDVLTITSTVNGKRLRDVDFSFTTAIPEPASLGLVVACGGGLLFVRRLLKI